MNIGEKKHQLDEVFMKVHITKCDTVERAFEFCDFYEGKTPAEPRAITDADNRYLTIYQSEPHHAEACLGKNNVHI